MDTRHERFASLVLPHLSAAYNLARWLVRDGHDAEDVVQDAVLRAMRHFDGFRGSDARPWLLAIVRNASYAWLSSRRPGDLQDVSVDELDATLAEGAPDQNPETLMLRSAERAMINEALVALPVAFREALILRELEGLSYREIAQITDVPIGTVMSRLSRARRLLGQSLGAIAQASGPKATRS
jgi:RNA polymerase sigma-70 factor (ECF subfamily)